MSSRVLITGTSNGIGLSTAIKFLNDGYEVFGLDIEKCPKELEAYTKYRHFVCDVSKKEELPDIKGIEILINNAGKQNSTDDIKNNLYSAIYVTEKYAFQAFIKSVLFNASVSAHTGFEFPEYVASKSGLLGYMKNVACRLSKYNATCNSISCGGVLTDLNKDVIEDKELWDKIIEVTPLKKWATSEEIADWIYFITVENKSMTGQDIIIDNGEKDLNCTFVWPNYQV